MKNEKIQPLTGKNNKRLTNHKSTNSGADAAFSNVDEIRSESKVSTPSLSSVEEAKDWVDNGSRL